MPSVVGKRRSRRNRRRLLQALSSTVAGTLGKPESYVLDLHEGRRRLLRRHAETPAAFTCVAAAITPETNAATSAALAEVLEAELGVPKGRYYINFFDSALEQR
ncbi:phenylpyruvate tautomerase [Aureococcus anophagefferens]|nr:phenylpyruvate tautomerase [Aureococcus anophagefferens]